jgi:hypothetical protein
VAPRRTATLRQYRSAGTLGKSNARALLLSGSLVLATGPAGFAYQDAPSPPPQPAPPPPAEAAKQTPEQLQQLVAAIALYPDALVAQILAAATYPDEIGEAERWMQQHSKLKGKKLADEVPG